MRPGGAIRRKWRIPDGKVGERSAVMFDYVLTHMGFMGFHKLSSFHGH
jgi:hypothetical protein